MILKTWLAKKKQLENIAMETVENIFARTIRGFIRKLSIQFRNHQTKYPNVRSKKNESWY